MLTPHRISAIAIAMFIAIWFFVAALTGEEEWSSFWLAAAVGTAFAIWA